MIPALPHFVWITFVLTVVLTGYLFYLASNRSNAFFKIGSLWVLLQSSVSLSLFYTNTYDLPPRPALLAVPPFLFILALFLTKSGRRFIDGLDLPMLTTLHMVRIPVEVVLFWLFLSGWVPELMTFSGRNFDILAGVTAPLVAWLVFTRKKLGINFLAAWNVVCIALLLFIVVNAVLSIQTPFQQFGFAQPNKGLMYFPFTLLPAFVVPVVMFSHLVVLRAIWLKKVKIK